MCEVTDLEGFEYSLQPIESHDMISHMAASSFVHSRASTSHTTDIPGMFSLDLPCLLHVASFITDHLSLVSFQSTCRWARTLRWESWDRLLEQKFGLSVQGSLNRKKAYAAYTELHCKNEQQVVRFGGVYTDGGIDARPIIYWCDNMFNPFQWAPYCSEATANISCVALLQRHPVVDVALLEHRTFIIRRMAHALVVGAEPDSVDAPVGPQTPEQFHAVSALLYTWKTLRLEHTFIQLVVQLLGGQPQGLLLLTGMKGNGQQKMQLLHNMCQRIQVLSALSSVYTLTALNLSLLEMVDRRALTRFTIEQQQQGMPSALEAAPKTTSLAIINLVSVSRIGKFSCPVRCGFVSLKSLRSQQQQPASPCSEDSQGSAAAAATAAPTSSSSTNTSTTSEGGHRLDALYGCDRLEDGIQRMQEVVASGAMCTGRDAASVLEDVSAGRLPPILRHVQGTHGEWIEFQPVGSLSHTVTRHTAADAANTRKVYRFDVPTVSAQLAALTEAARRKLKSEQAGAGDDDSAAASEAVAKSSPILWFRFYTRDEQAAAALLQSEPPQGLQSAGLDDFKARMLAANALEPLLKHDLMAAQDMHANRTQQEDFSGHERVRFPADAPPDANEKHELASASESAGPSANALSDANSGKSEGREPAGSLAGAPLRVIPSPSLYSGCDVFSEADDVMVMPLQQRRAGNCVCLHLVDQENRMEEVDWDDHGAPNIDVQSVAFQGFMIDVECGFVA